MKMQPKLALFISGGGTTAAAIITACLNGRLNLEPALIVASKGKIQGIAKARALGFPPENIKVIDPVRYRKEIFGDKLLESCRKRKIDIIGQYGWLPLTPVNLINQYKGRIINQHPGPLDPGRDDFGGKGMYGRRVHAAVLYFRKKTGHDFWTEAVTHLVTPEFDRGDIIKMKKVPILPIDTVEDLQKRILPVEHEVQIEALKDFTMNKVKIVKRLRPLIRETELDILNEAKGIAGIFYPQG